MLKSGTAGDAAAMGVGLGPRPLHQLELGRGEQIAGHALEMRAHRTPGGPRVS